MLPRRSTRALLALSALLLAMTQGCADSSSSSPDAGAEANTLSAEERAQGWRLLFDGRGLDGWRGYRRETAPAAWRVEGDALAFVPGGSDRGDLVSREQFGDFVLELEWKISEAGNSGIIYRVVETEDAPWKTGPEMQILDDDRHPDAELGVGGNRKAGSLYDLIAAPPGVVRPVGEWNRARVVARGTRVEHWLNGQRVVSYDVASDDWKRLHRASKFSDLPGFAVQPRGHVVLQDHGDRVWFRNVKIQPLG